MAVSDYHTITLLMTAFWLLLVVVRFRQSTAVLVGGLCGIGGLILTGLWMGEIHPAQVGLTGSRPLPLTVAAAALWCGLMLLLSPLTDRIAGRVFEDTPRLDVFRPIQESRAKLVLGIAAAWVLGGFFEELVFRGLLLSAVRGGLGAWLPDTAAVLLAIVTAAFGAGIVHLYQGRRAALIITQLSILFGLLYVVSGEDLRAVVVCHGLYDTVAFIRFATGRSRYARTGADQPAPHAARSGSMGASTTATDSPSRSVRRDPGS